MIKKYGRTIVTGVSLLAVFLIVIVVAFRTARAAPIGRGGGISQKLFTLEDGWFQLGTFTASATTPTATNRTAAAFVLDANNVTYSIKSGWNAIRLRLSSTTDGDSTVTDIFFMNSSDDHFNRISTLTWTTGTQTAKTSGQEYADTIAASNENWHITASTVSPTGNYIAEWAIDVAGSGTIGISPTTVTNNATLEITGY